MQGRHGPIVSKEEFELVQKMMAQRSSEAQRCQKNKGVYSDDLWRRKLRCQCGRAFAKTKWHKKKEITTYAYRCYSQNRTGTVSARQKRGLGIEGACPVPMVQEWKLCTMAQKVFHTIFDDSRESIKAAEALLGKGHPGRCSRIC